MDLADGWFCFERSDDFHRPPQFQSIELDGLFLENPLVKIIAAWCVSCSDRRLIYFWGDRASPTVNSKLPQSTSGGRYGYYQRKFKFLFDKFASASGTLLKSDLFEIGKAHPIKYVDTKSINLDFLVEVYAGKGFIFFYAVEAKEATHDLLLNRRTFLLGCSERGHEICREAKHFFERVPKEILKIELESERLFQQFYGPSAFDAEKEPDVPFMWPWQQCVEIRDGIPHPREISTISLVMDIRNSSSAMLLTSDPPKFAMFIDQVIDGAQDAIIKYGGYFDKDTGDGVVGHFSVPTESSSAFAVAVQALSAARAISIGTNQLCKTYQQHLSLSLGGLGCAIGLFSGKAVWLISWRGVRAIGSAVVNASRICANAAPGEVGYCNVISKVLESGDVDSTVFPLAGTRRTIKVTEVRESAFPEATFVKIT